MGAGAHSRANNAARFTTGYTDTAYVYPLMLTFSLAIKVRYDLSAYSFADRQ